MQAQIKGEGHKITAVIFTVLAYAIWLFVYLMSESLVEISKAEITAASIIGTLIVCAYVFIWRKTTGEFFTLYNIFLAFFVMFNFGQCLLWAIGIHSDEEIGEKLVYSSVRANNKVILQAQLIFIICYITLNCGAMLAWKYNKNMRLMNSRSEKSAQDIRYRYLFYTALVLSIVVIPVTLYDVFHDYMLFRTYGYSALYNDEAVTALRGGSITNIISQCFVPCLIGLLIGSQYDKRVRFGVYCLFGLYAIIKLFSGDRGDWINPFLILFWADYHFYKKRDGKKLVFVLIVGILALSVVDAVVSMRNTGFSWKNFLTTISAGDTNTIVSNLMEFGHSMGIVIILLVNQVKCPYGNTYFKSILTALGTGLVNRLFGIDYVQLHIWFPKYLNISYGTDFSIIGEAMLNFGVYAAPIVLLIEGFIIAKIAQSPYRDDISPLSLCLSMSIMFSVIKIARSTFWYVLNSLIYPVIIISISYIVISSIMKSKKTMTESRRQI